MPHPGYVSKVVEWTVWGPRYGLVSLTGRKKRRKAHRRVRCLIARLRAARERGGVSAFCAVALDAMTATPEERMGFGLTEGSGR